LNQLCGGSEAGDGATRHAGLFSGAKLIATSNLSIHEHFATIPTFIKKKKKRGSGVTFLQFTAKTARKEAVAGSNPFSVRRCG